MIIDQTELQKISTSEKLIELSDIELKFFEEDLKSAISFSAKSSDERTVKKLQVCLCYVQREISIRATRAKIESKSSEENFAIGA